MTITYTPKRTPVLHAVLWDGNTETLKQLPGGDEILRDDYYIDSFGAFHTFFDGLVFNCKFRRDIDCVVRGVTGCFFAVPKEEFEATYRPVEVDDEGRVVHRYPLLHEPVIPGDVKDAVARPEAEGRVWSMESSGQGVDAWVKERRGPLWGMPEWMIETSKPDAIEYWRDICPYWSPDVEVKLEQDENRWQWVITER